MNSVSADGEYWWENAEDIYNVRSGGTGVTTKLLSPPGVDWEQGEDGVMYPRVYFNLETTFDMVEGTFTTKHAQFIYPELSEDGRWLVSGWWNETIDGLVEK